MFVIIDDRKLLCNLLAGAEGDICDLFTLKFSFVSSQMTCFPRPAACLLYLLKHYGCSFRCVL